MGRTLANVKSSGTVALFNHKYSATSLIRSPTGLGKRDLNGEVTILQGANVLFFVLWNTIWDSARVTVMAR